MFESRRCRAFFCPFCSTWSQSRGWVEPCCFLRLESVLFFVKSTWAKTQSAGWGGLTEAWGRQEWAHTHTGVLTGGRRTGWVAVGWTGHKNNMHVDYSTIAREQCSVASALPLWQHMALIMTRQGGHWHHTTHSIGCALTLHLLSLSVSGGRDSSSETAGLACYGPTFLLARIMDWDELVCAWTVPSVCT